MAGIGFELQRMIDQGQGLLSRVRGYASAGLISSGPWIMTIVSLGIISAVGPLLTMREEYEMVRGIVTYAFAFSLITIGVLQMTVTRRVADMLYTENYDRVLPAFNACVAVVGVVQVVVGTTFCVLAELPPAFSFVAVALYAIVGVTWLCLIWLGITREYDDVMKAYGYGLLAMVLALAMAGNDTGSLGLLAAYSAGQALTMILLVRIIVRGMEAGGTRDYSVLQSVRLFPRIVVVGVAYNAAIWIDKMIFWFADGAGPHPWIQFHPLYDTCAFLAYLSVIPALAVNLVRVETSFYECYRAYYGAILGGTPLSVVDDKRKRMFANMYEGMVRLIRIQGAITALVIIFAPPIMAWVELPHVAVRIFRLCALGAFFHVMLLIVVLMQLYFELRREALMTSLAFLGLNGVCAAWSVDHGVASYGLGYAAASLIALVFGTGLMIGRLRDLDYLTFTSQPLSESERDMYVIGGPADSAGETEAPAPGAGKKTKAETAPASTDESAQQDVESLEPDDGEEEDMAVSAAAERPQADDPTTNE